MALSESAGKCLSQLCEAVGGCSKVERSHLRAGSTVARGAGVGAERWCRCVYTVEDKGQVDTLHLCSSWHLEVSSSKCGLNQRSMEWIGL